MTTLNEHWNKIFSAKNDSELGWYEDDVSQTLKFFNLIPLNLTQAEKQTTVFLAGAGTSLLVDKLLTRGLKLILNDISEAALNKLKNRIGTSEDLTWLHHNIAKPLPDATSKADIWIDRAVLHFLLEEADIQRYFTNLQSTLAPGGYALLAEFSTMGYPQCAGLDLHRYSIDEMTERLGTNFTLIQSEHYTFTNPSGDPRPYIYALYKKL